MAGQWKKKTSICKSIADRQLSGHTFGAAELNINSSTHSRNKIQSDWASYWILIHTSCTKRVVENALMSSDFAFLFCNAQPKLAQSKSSMRVVHWVQFFRIHLGESHGFCSR